jgi:hypothetical protein
MTWIKPPFALKFFYGYRREGEISGVGREMKMKMNLGRSVIEMRIKNWV